MLIITSVNLLGVHAAFNFNNDWAAKDVAEKKTRLAQYGWCLAESTLAVLICLLSFQPRGSLKLNGCGMQNIADWYPALYEPSPPCDNVGARSCANEVVFPLITWVLSFDAVLCGLVMLIRTPLTAYGPWGESKNSLYYALYGLPLQAVLHFSMGGLVYYVYPYLSILVAVVVLTIIMTKPADGTAGRNPPLATDNLLENTDGVLRPHQCSLGAAAATFYLC